MCCAAIFHFNETLPYASGGFTVAAARRPGALRCFEVVDLTWRRLRCCFPRHEWRLRCRENTSSGRFQWPDAANHAIFLQREALCSGVPMAAALFFLAGATTKNKPLIAARIAGDRLKDAASRPTAAMGAGSS